MPNVDIAAPGDKKEPLAAAILNVVGLNRIEVAATTLTLQDLHHGKLLVVTATCTITLPAGLRPDFSCAWYQAGTGQITFAAVGATVNEPDGYLKSSGQHSMGGIAAVGTDAYVLYGRVEP